MRKTLTIIASISMLFTACSKSGGGGGSTPTPTPTTYTLNAKEKLLLGRWRIVKTIDSIISASGAPPIIETKTNYTIADFIDLKAKKDFTKNYEPKFKDASTGSGGVISDFGIWYYDEGIFKLVLNNIHYEVLTVTGSELILWRNPSVGYTYISATIHYTK